MFDYTIQDSHFVFLEKQKKKNLFGGMPVRKHSVGPEMFRVMVLYIDGLSRDRKKGGGVKFKTAPFVQSDPDLHCPQKFLVSSTLRKELMILYDGSFQVTYHINEYGRIKSVIPSNISHK